MINCFIIYILFTVTLSADWVSGVKTTYSNIGEEGNKTFRALEEELIVKRKIQQKRFESVWNKIKDELIESSELYDKRDKVPNSAFWGTDKSDITHDIDDILNEIINRLMSDDLLEYKEKIEELNKEIKKHEKQQAEYREERIGAPDESLIHTTKEGYDKKIKESMDEITLQKNQIKIIENHLKENFQAMNIDLSIEQIDILLVRADGYDIIQVSLIMNILKEITNQILILMKNSDEDLVQAKRYYGMHLMSLALVVHIQQRYLDAVDSVYAVKLKKIVKRNQIIIRETQESIRRETNRDRKSIYKSNLEAQKLIFNVVDLYQQQLLSSRNQMKKAQDEAKKNILVAENTYKTVALSSSLYKLVVQNRLIFDKISQIQMPNIVPFKTIQMKKQYRVLQQEILEE